MAFCDLVSQHFSCVSRSKRKGFPHSFTGSGGVLATRRQELQDLSPEELAAARAAEVREKKVQSCPG